MQNILTIIIFLLLLTNYCNSQPSFERKFNSFNENDQGVSCQFISEGYAVIGNLNPCGLCIKGIDYLLVDTLGNISSEVQLGLNQNAQANILHSTINGNLLISGSIENSIQPFIDLFIKKIDPSGSIIWSRQYNGDSLSSDLYPLSICSTIDRGSLILLAANTGIRYMKIDENGDSMFTKTIGPPFIGGGNMTQLHDSGFAVVGGELIGDVEIAIVRLDTVGDTLWSRIIPNDSIGILSRIVETNDHGLALLGNIDDSLYNNPMCIIRTDSLGNFLWRKEYYSLKADNFEEIRSCSDNGFIVCGSYNDTNNIIRCFLFKTDANGDSLWYKEYQSNYASHLKDVRQTTDNGFVATGTITLPTTQPSVFLLKTDSLGNVVSQLDIDSPKLDFINVYPNPADDRIEIRLQQFSNKVKLSCYSISGEFIFNETILDSQVNIKTTSFKNGVYFLKIETGEFTVSKRFVVIH